MVGEGLFDRQDPDEKARSKETVPLNLDPADLSPAKDNGADGTNINSAADKFDNRTFIPPNKLTDGEKAQLAQAIDSLISETRALEKKVQQLLAKKDLVLDPNSPNSEHEFLDKFRTNTLASVQASLEKTTGDITFRTQIPIQVYPAQNHGMPETVYVSVPPKPSDISIVGNKLFVAGYGNGQRQNTEVEWTSTDELNFRFRRLS